MIGSGTSGKHTRWLFASLGLVLACTATGCQIDVGGQTLPSPHYMQDDVQYFPAGPEFILSREAAAMKAARLQAKNQNPQNPGMPQNPQVAPAPAEDQ